MASLRPWCKGSAFVCKPPSTAPKSDAACLPTRGGDASTTACLAGSAIRLTQYAVRCLLQRCRNGLLDGHKSETNLSFSRHLTINLMTGLN